MNKIYWISLGGETVAAPRCVVLCRYILCLWPSVYKLQVVAYGMVWFVVMYVVVKCRSGFPVTLPHALSQVISDTNVHGLVAQVLHLCPAQNTAVPPVRVRVVPDLDAHDARVEAAGLEVDAGCGEHVGLGEQDGL